MATDALPVDWPMCPTAIEPRPLAVVLVKPMAGFEASLVETPSTVIGCPA